MTPADTQRIAAEFSNCIINTVRRIAGEDTNRPFHVALLSEDALFWSRFERSFSTSFGQRAIEQISRIVVEANGAEQAQNQKQTLVSLSSAQLAAVDAHISKLRTGQLGRAANWMQDLREVGGHRVAEAPMKAGSSPTFGGSRVASTTTSASRPSSPISTRLRMTCPR